jgi:hypothetical protein
MKKIIIAAFMSLAAFAAQAQVVGSTAQTTTNTNSTAGALNQGVSLQNTFNSPDKTTYDGSYTVKSAPAIAAPAGYGSFSQSNCMVSATAGVSLIGFGATGQAPVDGAHCDLRQDQQNLNAGAMTIHNFVAANPALDDGMKRRMELKAAAMLSAAADMSCLASDRQRAVMEKQGLCGAVDDVATMDHRFGQPRNYQVDYASK